MKIIYVNKIRWGVNTPCYPYVTKNAIGIAQNHIETHLIVKNGRHEDTEHMLENDFGMQKPPYLQIHRLHTKTIIGSLFFYIKALRLVHKLTASKTIIITRNLKFLPFLILLKNKDYQVYYESHNFYYKLQLRNDIPVMKNLIKHLIEQVFLNRTDGIICLQREQKKIFQQYIKKPIYVFEPGLFMVEKREIPLSNYVLAYIGGIEPSKGVENIFSVLRLLPATYRLILFSGKNQQEIEWIQKKARENQVNNRLTVTGWVSQRALHKQLSKVHLGLVPLQYTFFNKYMTACSKVYDFFAHAIPVIASPIPSIKTMIRNNTGGVLVDWADPEQVAGEIRNMLEDNNLYQQKVQEVYELSKHLTWEKRGKRIISQLQEPV